MSNLINPIQLLPRNAPVTVASNEKVKFPLTVKIGSTSGGAQYFTGTFECKPNNDYIGLDINRYIKDIVNNNELTPVYGTNRITTYSNTVKRYYVTMLDSDEVSVFSWNGYLTNMSPLYRDILRIIDGLYFGAYAEYLEKSTATEIFENGTFTLGQTLEPSWIQTLEGSIVASTFPLSKSVFAITNPSGHPAEVNAIYLFDGSIDTEKLYVATIKIKKESLDNTTVVTLCGTDITDKIGTVEKYISVSFAGADFDPTSDAFLKCTFTNNALSETITLYSISLQEMTATWYNGTNYDILQHSRLDVYDNFSSFPALNFNKIVKGAPVFIHLWNPTGSALSPSITVTYYNDLATLLLTKTYSEIGTFPFKTMCQLQAEFLTYKYILFKISIPDSVIWNSQTRAIGFELIDPSTCKNNIFQLYYLNRVGGIDSIFMNGRNVKSSQITKQSIRNNQVQFEDDVFDLSTSKQIVKTYNVENGFTYELNSDFETSDKYKYLEELLSSPMCWLYDAELDLLQSVTIDDNSFVYKNFQNDKVFNFSINVRTQINNMR